MAGPDERRSLGDGRHLVGSARSARVDRDALRNAVEAEAVGEVVAAVVKVSERARPKSTDAAWFADGDWPRVRESTAKAAALLRT